MHATVTFGRTAVLFAVMLSIAAPGHAQTPSPSSADARARLVSMAEFMGKTPQLAVTVRAAYDTVQPSGEKIEWNEVRTLTVSRPNRLRVETQKSDGSRTLVIFDGKTITTYDDATRIYAQSPQTGDMDATLVHFVRDLGMRLPLAVLFLSRAGAEIDRRTLSVAYVQKTAILGAPAHHLAGRTDTVNFQVWIRDGDQPLPERLVLTYPAAPGQPQFRAEFSGWSLAEPSSALFTFAPPPNASKVPFLASLPQFVSGQGSASPKAGASPKSNVSSSPGAPPKKGQTP